MKLTKTLLLFVALAASLKSGAQSQFLFTQYDLNPVFTNPAQTGAYEGTYRVGGIFRSQWNSTANIYRPLTAFVDAPILMVAKRHWVGIGLMYANDEAGTHKLGSRLTAISGAFHYSLDKKFKNVLTLGLQMGVGSRGLTIDEANSFYSELKSGLKDPTARGTLDKSASFVDFNAGLLFKSTIDKMSNMSIGFSLAHLAKAKYSLLKTKPADVKIPLYIVGTVAYNRKLNSKVSIHPSILIQSQTAAFTANPQMMLGYRMTQKGTSEPMTLKAGLGYRANGNAANVLLGVEVKDIKVGVGYDLNAGALRNSVNDAIEIAIHYTGKIYKKPSVKPVMVCPKY